jgi:uncharacterized protein (DUF58 family)
MSARRLHVSRRLVAAIALAWVLAVAGLLVASTALVLAGALVGAVAFLGVSVPSADAAKAEYSLATGNPTEGQAVRSTVTATNDGRWSYLAEWTLDLPDLARVAKGRSAGLMVLPGGETWTASFELEMLLFGLHEVGPLRLRVIDPFGFASVETTVGESEEVSVYPRRDPMKKPVTDADQKRPVMGRYEVSQPGDGFEFFGLRDYRQGDRPRDINWKASGRSTELIVNQHERETNTEVVVLVDTRELTMVGRPLDSPFAEGCRAGLTIAETHLLARDDVRFYAYGEGIDRDRSTGSQRKMQDILDRMLTYEPAGDTPLGHVVDKVLPHLSPHSPVFVVSPLVGDDTVEDAVFALLKHEFPVTVLVPEAHWRDEASTGAAEREDVQAPSEADGEEGAEGSAELRRRLWEARQDQKVRAVRRQGAVVAYLDPQMPLYDLLRRMEVVH